MANQLKSERKQVERTFSRNQTPRCRRDPSISGFFCCLSQSIFERKHCKINFSFDSFCCRVSENNSFELRDKIETSSGVDINQKPSFYLFIDGN